MALFCATAVVAVEYSLAQLVHIADILRIRHVMQMRTARSYAVRILVFEVAARSATPLDLRGGYVHIPIVVYYRSFHNLLKKRPRAVTGEGRKTTNPNLNK